MKIAKFLSLCLSISIAISTVLAPIANAQGVFDINPPVIELDESTEGIAGETQVFTALVTDDRALRDVKLYYRFGGQEAYADLLMNRLGETDYYSANVETDATETRSIEYYVQARDEGGNRVIKGFAFDPFIRFLVPPQDAAEPITQPDPVVAQQPSQPAPQGNTPTQAPTEPAPRASSGFKWWYVVAGVLAAGAIAAAAGSGGGGSSPPAPTEQITVDVTVDRP